MINIIVCGRFHYNKYVHFIEKKSLLSAIYFSYKFKYKLVEDGSLSKNLFLKEYFMVAMLKIFSGRWRSKIINVAHIFWGVSLKYYFVPAKYNIFLMHGNCRDAMVSAKKNGCIVIGEAVNIHPATLNEMLQKEAALCGVKVSLVEKTQEIIQEAGLVDYLLCPSKAIAKSYIEYGFRSDRVIVLPYGIDLNNVDKKSSKFESLSDRDVIKIVCVAQIIIRKGQHILMNFIERYRINNPDKRIEVTLVGSCDDAYLDYVKSISNKFAYINHVNNREIINFISGYDVFILPSLEDGFGVVVSEAIQADVRVLVSKNAGASEIIEMNGGGYTYDCFSYESFEFQLKNLIYSSEIKKFNGFRSGWDAYADKLVHELDNIRQI